MGANEAGILIEIIGAAILVFSAWNARRALKSFPAPLVYNNFVQAVEKLLQIIGGQFIDQLKGFVLLAIGLLLQLYGSLK